MSESINILLFLYISPDCHINFLCWYWDTGKFPDIQTSLLIFIANCIVLKALGQGQQAAPLQKDRPSLASVKASTTQLHDLWLKAPTSCFFLFSSLPLSLLKETPVDIQGSQIAQNNLPVSELLTQKFMCLYATQGNMVQWWLGA